MHIQKSEILFKFDVSSVDAHAYVYHVYVYVCMCLFVILFVSTY